MEIQRFSTPGNREYLERARRKKLLVEHTFHPSVEAEFGVSQLFKNLGWESSLNISGTYFPQLVKEFYANIEQKKSLNLWAINTFVKGQRLRVTERTIADALGITSGGRRWSLKSNQIMDEPSFNRELALDQLNLRLEQASRGPIASTKNLTIRDRLFVYMLGTNVFPHASSNNELRICDIYSLWKATQGPMENKVSLPSIIISEIRAVIRDIRCHYRFPVLISRLLARMNVDLTEEEQLETTTEHHRAYNHHGNPFAHRICASPRSLAQPGFTAT